MTFLCVLSALEDLKNPRSKKPIYKSTVVTVLLYGSDVDTESTSGQRSPCVQQRSLLRRAAISLPKTSISAVKRHLHENMV